MRSARLVSLLLAAGLLAGCGDRRLILRVDVLSYFDPAQTTQAYFVPAALGGAPLGEQPMVDDLEINLFEGLSGASSVRSVTIRASVVWNTTSGSGADTVRVYLSDEATPPLSTTPIFTLPVALAAGVADTVNAVLGDDPRVADLFSRRRVRLAITNSVRGPVTPPDLAGTVRLRVLDAVAIAARKPL